MKAFFLSFLIVSSSLVYGQTYKTSKEFKVTKGTPYPVVDAYRKIYLSKGNQVLSVKIFGKSVIMQKFDADQTKEISKTVFDKLPKNYVYEGLFELQNKYYFFYSLWDGDNKKEQLFAKEIDFDLGSFVGEDKLLISVNEKITGSVGMGAGLYNFMIVDKFTFNTSFDDSKILIKYRIKPQERDDSKNFDKIGLYVFDNNLATVWGKQVEMPYTEKKMDNIDYSLDKEGNVYVLSRVYNDNSTKLTKKGEEVNYHFELFKYADKGSTFTKASMTIKDKHISDIWMFENPNNYIICGGYYSSTKYMDLADGLFTFKVNNKGEILDTKMYEIPLDIINQFKTEREVEKNKKADEKGKELGIMYLKLKDLLVQSDGSIILIGEQDFEVTYTDSKGNTRTVQHNHDIIATKIDPKGNLSWMRKLPKRQTGMYNDSYSYIQVNGQHYILYLDNIKNINLPINKVPVFHSGGMGGFLTAYKIDDNLGEVSKLSLFDLRNVQGTEVFQFSTNRIVETSPKQFVAEVYIKKKQDMLIKVDIVE